MSGVLRFLSGLGVGSLLAFFVFCLTASNRDVRRVEDEAELREAIERLQP